MYMIEITEEKVDGLLEHLEKGIHCLSKVKDCLEEMKDGSSYNERFDEDDEEYYRREERYGNRGGSRSSGSMNMRRGQGGGRYSRY